MKITLTISIRFLAKLCSIFRRHTLLFVTSSSRLLSCGLGANGQLGLGTHTKEPTPTLVSTVLAPTPKHHVQHVYAGGDTCFVLSSATQPTEDMRIQNAREAILKLDENRLEEMTSFLEKQRPPLSKLRSEKFTNKFIDIMSFFYEFYPLNQTSFPYLCLLYSNAMKGHVS